MTLREVLLEATELLERQRIPNPRLCAEVLLAFCLSVDRPYLYAHDDRIINDEESAAIDNAIYQRGSGVPVQYIVGRQEFYGRDFAVNPSVLIPRPETEFIVDAVLETKPGPDTRIIDVGTGSGCIAATLALEIPGSTVFAVDISEEAVRVARENARKLQAPVSFANMDLLDAVSGTFDFVVTNPPYVAIDDLHYLQREVREHEPHVALFSGDGLGIYKRLFDSSTKLLKPGGKLVAEIGAGMEERVVSLIDSSWNSEPSKRDLQGIPRTIIAVRKP